jgi:hypothetical protein
MDENTFGLSNGRLPKTVLQVKRTVYIVYLSPDRTAAWSCCAGKILVPKTRETSMVVSFISNTLGHYFLHFVESFKKFKVMITVMLLL